MTCPVSSRSSLHTDSSSVGGPHCHQFSCITTTIRALPAPRRSHRSHRNTTKQTTKLIVQAGWLDNVFDGLKDQLSGNKTTTNPQQQEEATFKQLDPSNQGSVDGSSEDTFGPLALLAVGFLHHEFEALQGFLAVIGAHEVGLVPCTKGMLQGTLGDALMEFESPPNHEAPPLGARRVLFLSGMYASEVMEVVSGYKDDGLPDAVFAAAVPRSWSRNLAELIHDVTEDHAKMQARKAQAALEAAQRDAAGIDREDGI